MYRRLDAVSRELDRLGLTHRSSYLPMLERLAAGDPVGPLKTLADVLEPATFGQRIRTHKYTQLTPLDRVGGRGSAGKRNRPEFCRSCRPNGSRADANLAHPLA